MSAHRAWSVLGVTAASGHTTDGMGLCAFDLQTISRTSLLGAGTGGASSTDTAGGWSIAEALNGSTAANNGWYGGDISHGGGAGFAGQRFWYDFGGSPVEPAILNLCSLNGFSWTVGQQIAVEWTDDDPTASPTWTRLSLLSGYAAADNRILSFLLVPALAVPRMSAVVTEGPASEGIAASRMSAVVIEGTQRFFNVTRMSAVVIEGPPDMIRRRAGMLIA